MPNNLFSLFDERLRSQRELVSSEPQSLDSISKKEEEQEYFLKRMREFERVRPKVDYSSFGNFVFFNSALDYFNITGERILNEYPYDGSVDGLQAYHDELDDYQAYVLDSLWPRCSSHLSFDPSRGFAYVLVDDHGMDSGVTRTNLLSPGTGSWTVEMWCVPPPALTGSQSAMFLVQKVSGSTQDGYSVFFSGSTVNFRLSSGSSTFDTSVRAVPGVPSYYAFTLDRSSTVPTVRAMTGSLTEFPVVAVSSSAAVGSLLVGGPRFSMGSGSLTGKTTLPLTGGLDNVRVWCTALSLTDVSSSYNAKVFAQKNLRALWRFNESGSIDPYTSNENSIVLDSSGHRLNGRIVGYYQGLRDSGSLVPYESPDPILSFDAPEVQALVYEQQTSGSAYDRDNDNIIYRLFPAKFFEDEDNRGMSVLKNFLYIWARYFDSLKVRIDQFVNILRVNYGQFDQAPDELLPDVARFFGWEFTGNFLSADAFQYLIGRSILPNTSANAELDTKLYQIKNEFWRRTLLNLMHVYKTKGTRESVDSLLRVYGVNGGFVRLKEYGFRSFTGFDTFRIATEKSVAALTFGSGSATGSYVSSSPFSSSLLTVESRVAFPTTSSSGLTASILTGTVWSVNTPAGALLYRLYYVRDSLSSITGSLYYTGSVGIVALTGVPIFDNRWHNVAVVRDPFSGSVTLDVRTLSNGELGRSSITSSLSAFPSSSVPCMVWVGATASLPAQHWAQEFRVWDEPLGSVELDDHASNFQSFGTEDVASSLVLHWRLNENVTASSAGDLTWTVQDVSGRSNVGQGHLFAASLNPYRKFLNEYSYIASPDLGWNEEKVRTFHDRSEVGLRDSFSDDRWVSLDFNMVDALNEDISQMLAAMDLFDNAVGLPANRYRGSYQELSRLRNAYFKRLQGRLNFRVFFDMLEFFDRSFIDVVRRLIPARALFFGEQLVVESHMLERPKFQWTYRRQEESTIPEGTIRIYIRT